MATRALHRVGRHAGHGLSWPAFHVPQEVVAGLLVLVVLTVLCFILIYAVAMPLGEVLRRTHAL